METAGVTAFGGISLLPLGELLWAFLPIWLFGALTGYLLPRPKGLLSSWTSLLLTGTGFRNALLAGHGVLLIRETWYRITDPGTFRRLSHAVLMLVLGKGWHFDFPCSEQPSAPSGCSKGKEADSWYVTERDLAFFQYHGLGSGGMQGAGPWEVVMDKEIPNALKYTAWRRVLPNGKTEYKSSMIVPDATAEEFIDLYFDDSFRPQWDSMISACEIAEHGNFEERQQVVRWTRKFPFSFINSRRYTIARRLFRRGSELYGITKSVDHPSLSSLGGDVVSVDAFYSMWRSTTVDCPWGSGRPAAETTLLHHEQLKIPENLARFAVRHGMWGFVRKMSQELPGYIAARRARGVLPTQLDPNAYGAGFTPNPPGGGSGGSGGGGVMRSSLSVTSMSGTSSSTDGGGDEADRSSCDGMMFGRSASSGLRRVRSSASAGRKLRGFAALAIASSLAVLVGRKTSEAGSQEAGFGSASGGAGSMSRCSSVPAQLSGAGRIRRLHHRFSPEPFTE